MKSLTEFILEADTSKYSTLGKLEVFSYKNGDNVVDWLYNFKKDFLEELRKKYNEKDYNHPALGFWAKISGRGEEGNKHANGYKITNYGNKEKWYVRDWSKIGMFLNYILDNLDNLENIKKELSDLLDINLEKKGSSNILTIEYKRRKGDFLKFKFKK